MLAFTAAAFFLLITPGPGVLTTAGVGSAFGFRAGLPYLSGIVFGSLLVMAAVATGLAAFLLSYPPVRTVLLVLSAAYLLYIAGRIALTGSRVAFIAAERPLGFANGVALQIVNPKAYAVLTTLFTGFAFYPANTALEALMKAAVFTTISVPVHVLWLYAGDSLKRLALGAGMTRAINIAMAAAMLAVVALALMF
ncbi:MAG: LysE family translocator, partial [Geminicoccaceae bacterium]